MKRCIGIVAAAALVLAGTMLTALSAGAQPGGRAPDVSGVPEKLETVEVFAPFIGEWEIVGTWDDGRPIKARNTYAWHMNRKHIKCATFVAGPEGEYQRYDGLLVWHPRKKTLGSYSFAFDGNISEYRAETTDGRTFRFGFSPWDDEDTLSIRQTIEFTGPDVFVWTVEARAGESWKRLIRGEWKRKVAAKDAG